MIMSIFSTQSASAAAAPWLLAVGCVTFPGALFLLQRLWFNSEAGSRIRKKFDFSDKDCTDISVKTISAFQAILASVAGIVVCFNCYENVLYDTSKMTLVYAWFGIPYFVYDTFAMFYASRMSPTAIKSGSIVKDFVKFIFRSPIIVIHHMILAPIGFTVLVFFRDGIRNGDFFMGIVYLMEISTPFVSLRFILSKFKLKSSLVYTLNGIAMLVFFPVFRIGSIFYAVRLYAQQSGIPYLEVLINMPIGWKFIFLAAITPQIYWYYLMCNGLVKMLRPSPKNCPSEKEGEKNGSPQQPIVPPQIGKKEE